MSEQACDPRTPIPNDDSRCHCALEPGGSDGGDAVVMTFGDGVGGEGKVAMHLDCPHHGGIVRDIRKAALKGFSIG
jgi:hypothetical protein